MISQFICRSTRIFGAGSQFCITTARADYYELLGLSASATLDQIKAQYGVKTEEINPKTDSVKFQKLSEAYVILSNLRTRDAYDSLLRVQKSSFFENQEVTKVEPKSYWAERVSKKKMSFEKKFNLDEYGRFKGGLPNKIGYFRGAAKGFPGQIMTRHEHDTLVKDPENIAVDEQISESFKEFHQDEREAREMRRPWVTVQVDYDVLGYKTFRAKYGALLNYGLAFFILLPFLGTRIEFLLKSREQDAMRAKYAADEKAKAQKVEESKASA